MSEAPLALRYTREHEWVAKTDNPALVRIGITDFAQSALGDIVYVQLHSVGDEGTVVKVFGEFGPPAAIPLGARGVARKSPVVRPQ